MNRESSRGELGPLDVPRPVRRDAERPPRTTQRFESFPHPWEAPHRPRDAVDVLAPEVARVAAEPERLPQMDEIRRIGPLPEPFTDDGLRAHRQSPRPREATGPVLQDPASVNQGVVEIEKCQHTATLRDRFSWVSTTT